MRVEDLDLIVDGSASPERLEHIDPAAEREVFRACVEEVMDPGPYRFNGRGVEIERMFLGDIAFISTRVAALSARHPEMVWDVTCPSGHRMEFVLHPRDLPVVPLVGWAREQLAVANRFAFDIPESGLRGGFRLFTAGDIDRIAKMARALKEAKRGSAVTVGTYCRIVDVEGLERDPARYAWAPDGQPDGTLPVWEDPLWAWCRSLMVEDLQDLARQIAVLDFGIRTDDVQARCRWHGPDGAECGLAFPVRIPGDRRLFFSPGPGTPVTV